MRGSFVCVHEHVLIVCVCVLCNRILADCVNADVCVCLKEKENAPMCVCRYTFGLLGHLINTLISGLYLIVLFDAK